MRACIDNGTDYVEALCWNFIFFFVFGRHCAAAVGLIEIESCRSTPSDWASTERACEQETNVTDKWFQFFFIILSSFVFLIGCDVGNIHGNKVTVAFKIEIKEKRNATQIAVTLLLSGRTYVPHTRCDYKMKRDERKTEKTTTTTTNGCVALNELDLDSVQIA